MTYHFIVTLAFASGLHTVDSTYVTKPGETRKDVYQTLADWAKAHAAAEGMTGPSTVTFFSLEPNALEAGAR